MYERVSSNLDLLSEFQLLSRVADGNVDRHVCINNACVDPKDRQAQEKHLEKGPDGKWKVPALGKGRREVDADLD